HTSADRTESAAAERRSGVGAGPRRWERRRCRLDEMARASCAGGVLGIVGPGIARPAAEAVGVEVDARSRAPVVHSVQPRSAKGGRRIGVEFGRPRGGAGLRSTRLAIAAGRDVGDTIAAGGDYSGCGWQIAARDSGNRAGTNPGG